MLTAINVDGVPIVGEQHGPFVVHPAIMRDADTGEFYLNAATWSIHHAPSGKDLMRLHEEDPLDVPGHPLAIDMDKVRDFLAWIVPFADWSAPDPSPEFPSSAHRESFRLFMSSPVFWNRPEVTG